MASRGTKLIGIDEAAALFGNSVQQVRKYRSQGLLRVAEVDGHRHLYDMAEVVLLKHLIREMRLSEGMSLTQVSRRLNQMMGRTTGGRRPEQGGVAGSPATPQPPLRHVLEPPPGLEPGTP